MWSSSAPPLEFVVLQRAAAGICGPPARRRWEWDLWSSSTTQPLKFVVLQQAAAKICFCGPPMRHRWNLWSSSAPPLEFVVFQRSRRWDLWSSSARPLVFVIRFATPLLWRRLSCDFVTRNDYHLIVRAREGRRGGSCGGGGFCRGGRFCWCVLSSEEGPSTSSAFFRQQRRGSSRERVIGDGVVRRVDKVVTPV